MAEKPSKKMNRVERGIYKRANKYIVKNQWGRHGSFDTLEEARLCRDEKMPVRNGRYKGGLAATGYE
jgi:hypothetical protein